MKEKNIKYGSNISKSISLGKNINNFQNSKRREKLEDEKLKTFTIKIQISLNNNENKKEMNALQKSQIEIRKIKNKNQQFLKKNQQCEKKKAKFNGLNSIKKEIIKSKNLAKNSTKGNNKKYKMQANYSQRNKEKGISKKKKNSTLAYIEKIIFTIDDFEAIYLNKETLSTNTDTNSTRENKMNHSKPKKKATKTKNSNKPANTSRNRNIRNNFQKKIINNKNNDKSTEDKMIRREKRLLTVLTPIPLTIRKKKGNQIQSNEKDIQNTIALRRQEYNEYIKSINKPKLKTKPQFKPGPKPKIYDINKVNIIQKIYKGFQTRDINQIVNRLKINLCANELFCLILNEVFIHVKKRITFNLLKLYYHEPFHSIYNEVGFTDRIYIKLSHRYYNFNNL